MTQPRSHYQKHDGNMPLRRQPIASGHVLSAIDEIISEANRLKQATTQAAFDLRLSQIKRLVKSL